MLKFISESMGGEECCYLVDSSILTDSCTVLEEVRAKVCCKAGKEPVVLRCSASRWTQGETILGFFLKLYRKHGLHRNERATVLSRDDQLVAVQLVMAEKQKQTDGEFDVDTEDVLKADNQVVEIKLSHDRESRTESLPADHIYNLYQKFLEQGNFIDWADIATECLKEARNNEHFAKDIQQNISIVILDRDLRIEELSLLELLCEAHLCCGVEVKVTPHSLDESFTPEVCITSTTLAAVTAEVCGKNHSPGAEFTSPQKSATESFVWSTVLSYLELLVNSRSELSLARIINTPSRGLDHSAFTDIKRYGRSLNMPVYQATMSYIIKLRLGGKGYAPKTSCPLAQHVKGIGEFSDLMQKLQTTLEEDVNTSSACRRVVNSLKIALLKDKDSRLRRSSIETAVQSIQASLSQLIASTDQASLNTPDRPAGRGGSMVGRQTVKVIRSLLDQEATKATTCHSSNALGDLFSSQKTPIQFPSILSKFRSPVEAEEDREWDATLAQRVHQNQVRLKDAAKQQGRTVNNKSDFDWAVPLHSLPDSDANLFLTSSPVVVMPSKTLVQPGANTLVGLSASAAVLESANDQENLERSSDNNYSKVEKQKKNGTNVDIREVRSQAKVRTCTDLDDDKDQPTALSQPPAKKQKIQSTKTKKTVRRKLIPQIKGQQNLTKFFRF